MEQKVAQFVNKGMWQDFSESKASNEYAYENHNIRITTRGDNSALSITNEKGNVEIYKNSTYGSLCGHALVDKEDSFVLVLFFHGEKDSILKVEFYPYGSLKEETLLYSGNLGFSNYIETLVHHESENIIKVYWLDGVNVPRFINIEANNSNYTDDSFDFFRFSTSEPSIDIETIYGGQTGFSSGVIQYVITYYNKYGVETRPVYTSSLYNMSFEDRGGKPDETVDCKFKITINKMDTTYDYMRIYSLQRNSYNADVVANLVQEIKCEDLDESFYIIDNGFNLTNVDATSFLFKNTAIFSASTFASKDGVLFLGDLKINNSNIEKTIKTILEENSLIGSSELLAFGNNENSYNATVIWDEDNSEVYNYNPKLNLPSNKTKTFKFGETYRFGIQLQDKKGTWTAPIWLGDYKNDKRVKHFTNKEGKSGYVLPYVWFNFQEFKSYCYPHLNDYEYGRLLMVEPTFENREIKAQGFITPTVFNLKERMTGGVYAEPSWFPRFTSRDYHYQNVNTTVELNSDFSATTDVDLLKLEVNDALFVEKDDTIKYEGLYTPLVENKEPTLEDKKALLTKISVAVKALGTTTLPPNVSYMIYEYSLKFTFKYQLNGETKTAYLMFPNDEYTVRGYIPNTETFKFVEHEVWGMSNLTVLLKALRNSFENYKLVDKQKGYLVPLDEIIEEYVKTLNYNLFLSDFDYESKVLPKLTDAIIHNLVYTGYGEKAFNRYELDLGNENTKNSYFIDASLFNFYSPELKNFSSSDLSKYKLRIIGYTELKGVNSDYNIIVDNIDGAVIPNFDFNNDFNKIGLKSYPLYNKEGKTSVQHRSYLMFPWHKNGSIVEVTGDAAPTNSILKNKKFANLWYCDTYYDPIIDDIEWSPRNGIFDAKIYREDDTIIPIKDLNYKGNYSNLITPLILEDKGFDILGIKTTPSMSKTEIDYSTKISNTELTQGRLQDSVSIKYNSPLHAVIKLNGSGNIIDILPNYGYPKDFTGTVDIVNNSTISSEQAILLGAHNINNWYLKNLLKEGNTVPFDAVDGLLSLDTDIGKKVFIYAVNAQTEEGSEILVPYRRFVMQGVTDAGVWRVNRGTKGFCLYGTIVGYDSSLRFNIYIDKIFYPTEADPYYDVKQIVETYKNEIYYIADPNSGYMARRIVAPEEEVTLYDQSVVTMPVLGFENTIGFSNGTSNDTLEGVGNALWIAELYEDIPNKYGGTNEASLKANVFIPISDSVNIKHADIIATEGDTYFQRWDCLRISPTTEEDVNSIIDIVSCTLETHENLDGRSDVNRKRSDLVNARPENTNIFNEVYNQNNNFFTYNILDDKFEQNNYSNCYTWGAKKIDTSDIDSWVTNLMINVESLDSKHGKINKILLWNDYLLTFQNSAIARINYNNQSTITTTQGVPIEIAASGLVSGHTYLNNVIGCQDKKSIVISPAGIYFVDKYVKSINIFNGSVMSLSNNKGFKDWCNINLNINEDIYSSYDSIHNDYYLTTQSTTLCFSETLQAFSSFFDYEKTPIMFNAKSAFLGLSINDGSVWKFWDNVNCCNFNNEQKHYWIKYLVNPEPLNDKIFNSIEYRHDVQRFVQNHYEPEHNETFDHLNVNNDYQEASLDISNVRFLYPNIEKKFKIWRLNIPRASYNNRDRIRNPWVYITLTKTSNTNYKMELHDFVVKYFA